MVFALKMVLLHSEYLTNLQDRGRFDVVQTTESCNGGVVTLGDEAEIVTTAHLVVFALGTLGCLLLIGCIDLLLAVEVLLVGRVDAEIGAFEQEFIPAQLTCTEVYKTFRVKGLPHISTLKVEVWSRTATRVTTQGDRLTRNNSFTLLDKALREVSVVGLQAIIVAHNDERAIARRGAFRESHTAIEG